MPPKTVLLVEPDEYQRDILSGALEHHGYAVVAIRADELPDVVGHILKPDLLVVAFPATLADGRSAFEWIAGTRQLGGVPVLCVASEGEPWALEKARDTGCTAVCVKPVDTGRFAVQVRDMIGPSIH